MRSIAGLSGSPSDSLLLPFRSLAAVLGGSARALGGDVPRRLHGRCGAGEGRLPRAGRVGGFSGASPCFVLGVAVGLLFAPVAGSRAAGQAAARDRTGSRRPSDAELGRAGRASSSAMRRAPGTCPSRTSPWWRAGWSCGAGCRTPRPGRNWYGWPPAIPGVGAVDNLLEVEAAYPLSR